MAALKFKQYMKKIYTIVLVLVMMLTFTSCGGKGISDSKCLEDFTYFDTEYTFVDFESFETYHSLEDEDDNSYYIEGTLEGSDEYADYEMDVSLWYLDYDQGWELEDAEINSVYIDLHTGRTPEELQYALDNDEIWGFDYVEWEYVSDRLEDYDFDGNVEQVVELRWEREDDVLNSEGTTTVYFEYKGGYWVDEELDDFVTEESHLKLEGKTYENERGSFAFEVTSVPENGIDEITVQFLKSGYEDEGLVEKGKMVGYLVKNEYGTDVSMDGFYVYKFSYKKAWEDGSLHDESLRIKFPVKQKEENYCRVALHHLSEELYEQ